MAILYNFSTTQDIFKLSVFEPLTYNLFFVTNSNEKIETKEINSDIDLFLTVQKDGQYKVILSNINESVEFIFNVIKFLQLSIIEDTYYAICKNRIKTLCEEFTEKVVPLDVKQSIYFQSIYTKLLSYQSLYTDIYSQSFKQGFLSFLQESIKKQSVNLQLRLNDIISYECLYGISESSKIIKLFKTYLGLYWASSYFTELRLASTNQELIDFIKEKYRFNEISNCLEDFNISNFDSLEQDFNIEIDANNIPPTISNFEIFVNDGVINNDILTYTLNANIFLKDYFDAENDQPNKIKFPILPLKGNLKLEDNTPITLNTEYSIVQMNNAKYVSTVLNAQDNFDIINFQISDNNTNSKFSNMAFVNVNTSGYQNQPIADVGDLTLQINNRVEYIFNLADFTTNLTPQYLDPEGDPLDAIIIDSLPASGQLLLNSNPVTINTIITAQNLVDGLFKFVAPDVDSATNNNFNFRARDTGSMIWVG